jgi:hypothetical protein
MPKDCLPEIAPVESEVFWYQKPLNILQTNIREIDARDTNGSERLRTFFCYKVNQQNEFLLFL